MFTQIAIGTATMIATVLLSALFAYVAVTALIRCGPWLVRRPHEPKFLAALVAVMIWTITAITLSVWTWALLFWALGAFDTLEACLYFAFASFTTLGFGDLLLPQEFRLLSGLAATNGLLLFGLFTAFLVEIMRRIRTEQLRGKPDRE